MTNFIDLRAQAIGITGSLTTDQRIALDLNAQIEKHQLAVRSLTTAVSFLANGPEEDALLAINLEAMRLHVLYDRQLYATQNVDTSSIPTVLP